MGILGWVRMTINNKNEENHKKNLLYDSLSCQVLWCNHLGYDVLVHEPTSVLGAFGYHFLFRMVWCWQDVLGRIDLWILIGVDACICRYIYLHLVRLLFKPSILHVNEVTSCDAKRSSSCPLLVQTMTVERKCLF